MFVNDEKSIVDLDDIRISWIEENKTNINPYKIIIQYKCGDKITLSYLDEKRRNDIFDKILKYLNDKNNFNPFKNFKKYIEKDDYPYWFFD